MTFELFMQHIDFFCANLRFALGFYLFIFFFLFCFCVSVLSLVPCLGRLELIGLPPFPLCLPLGVSFLRMTVAERPLRN